jgi:hypothetical protein
MADNVSAPDNCRLPDAVGWALDNGMRAREVPNGSRRMVQAYYLAGDVEVSVATWTSDESVATRSFPPWQLQYFSPERFSLRPR